MLTEGPLIRLALRAIHLLPRGEKGSRLLRSRFDGLLPVWEKVPEGRMRGRAVGAVVAAVSLVLALMTPSAVAETIANPIAAFSGLDKITGRITKFDVYIGETVQFGALQITPRACYTHPATEVQRTSVFVEVDQVSMQQTVRRIFTGWMFADSPALNAIDHAVYDIWLVDCTTVSDTPPPNQVPAATEAPAQ